MRRWIGPLALLAAMLGVAWVALARTEPQLTCNLPTGIPISCPPQANCDVYGATCDTVNMFCVCPMVADAGVTDGMTTTVDSGGGGSGGSGGSGSVSHGGGQTGPQRTGGCSFVP